MRDVEVRQVRVPALGLGTWQMRGKTCRRAVERALGFGYRHIDTAEMYGNEGEIGEAIAASGVERERLWLTTKVWPNHLERDALHRSAQQSLRKLRTDYVDLLLIHWPNPGVALEHTLDAMRELQARQQVRFIGVSNFPPQLLKRAIDHAPIFCDQVEFHVQRDQPELQRMAVEHRLLLTAYSPLARGRVSDEPELRRIARAHGKSAAQVALRWLIQKPRVAAIPKAASEAHLRSNIDLFDFELSEEEMRRIDDVDGG